MWLCAYMWIFANMNMHLHMFACMNLPESQCCEGVTFRVSIEERMLIRQHWNSLLEILSFWWYHRNVLRLKSSWIRIIHFLKKFFSENVLFRKQHHRTSQETLQMALLVGMGGHGNILRIHSTSNEKNLFKQGCHCLNRYGRKRHLSLSRSRIITVNCEQCQWHSIFKGKRKLVDNLFLEVLITSTFSTWLILVTDKTVVRLWVETCYKYSLWPHLISVLCLHYKCVAKVTWKIFCHCPWRCCEVNVTRWRMLTTRVCLYRWHWDPDTFIPLSSIFLPCFPSTSSQFLSLAFWLLWGQCVHYVTCFYPDDLAQVDLKAETKQPWTKTCESMM